MSEDLQVQQTPQQRGNYAVPGLIAGGAIGGAGGVIAASKGLGIQTKPDLDKVFAQKPDVFDKQIEKAEGEIKTAWETAKEWATKIQDKNTEYESMSKKLEDTLPKINEYRKALAKELYELKKADPDYKKLVEAVKNAKASVTDHINASSNLSKKIEELTKKAIENISNSDTAKNYINIKAELEKEGFNIINKGQNILKGKNLLKQLSDKKDSINEIVNQAKEALKESADKFKLPSKTWTGIAAGAALALAGLAIGAAVKKDEA